MFDVYVNIYVFNFDVNNSILNIVSSNKQKFAPLSKKLDQSNFDLVSVIKEILSDYTICNIDCLKPILFDIQTDNKNVNINYIVTTPIDLELSECYYINVEQTMLSNKTIQKALLYV